MGLETWFDCMFRVIHVSKATVPDVEEPDMGDDSDEEEEDDEDETDDIGIDDCNVERVIDERWCGKAALLLDHLVSVSKKMCLHPSFALAIGEMMKQFKGRSGQTARMKNKPIKEGHKFFAICCSLTGFVLDMIPNGRLEKTKQKDCRKETNENASWQWTTISRIQRSRRA